MIRLRRATPGRLLQRTEGPAQAAGVQWLALAVRGAVCVGGTRGGDLDPVRLRKWVDALAK